MNFVCDGSRNLWQGTLKGESKTYGVVAVDTLLWLTNNVTKTHWSSSISDESNGVAYCPEGWIMPSYEEWNNMFRNMAVLVQNLRLIPRRLFMDSTWWKNGKSIIGFRPRSIHVRIPMTKSFVGRMPLKFPKALQECRWHGPVNILLAQASAHLLPQFVVFFGPDSH